MVTAAGDEWTGPGASPHNATKQKPAPGCLSPPKMAPCDGDSWADGCRRNGAAEAMDGASAMQGRAREEAGQGWLRSAAFRWEACDAAEVVGSSPAMRRCISVPLLLGAQSKNIVWLTLRVREAGYVGLVAWSGGSMACLQSVWSQLQDHLPQHVCLICLPYVSALCVCSRCGLSCRTICR